MKLIPLDAVLAEIEKIKEGLQRNCNPNSLGNLQECLAAAEIEALDLVVDSINSLEIKEEDLEKEIERVRKTHFVNDDFEKATLEGRQITNIAKHFFKLGINASNLLTWEDMREIDRLCGYLLTLKGNSNDKEFYQEVLKRFKAQKGG